MNNTRLGCLSPSAIIATLITVFVISGIAIFSGNGFFSAGSLNAQPGEVIGGVTSHAAIGNDCAKCHPAPWSTETLGDRCMVCHTDISSQLADSKSLHGVMMKDPSLTCRPCHTDHKGPAASLTIMLAGEFPHNFTGFSLVAHTKTKSGEPFTCADCHADDISRFDPAVCQTCHEKLDSAFLASHDLAYGSDCRGCHDGVETISKKYDHSRASFSLQGAHKDLACEKCHLNAHTLNDFKSQPADCAACHLEQDAHNGEFGRDCGSCHTPLNWESVTFDHNLTNFKLDGAHGEAKCADCHANNVFKGTPTACFACHEKDDEHAGKFGQDCAACHKTAAWKPAAFDHNLSAFKLDGAHINVACADCHKNNVFKGTPVECAACHADPAYHAGMFPGQACSACHVTAAWRPAKFEGTHTFPINHGEKNNTCADCHQPTLKEWTCYTCHDQAEVAGKHIEEGIPDFKDCLKCHATGQKEEGHD
jgi:hypothetical protein